MALYEYTAIDQFGKKTKGTINADSEKMARSKIRNEGLIPIALSGIAEVQTKRTPSIRNIDRRIKNYELVQLTRELCALVSAGLEIEQSVRTVADQIDNKKLQQIMLSVHERIREGYSLSAGLKNFPKAFPKVYVATIQAGEEAGHLGEVLAHLADYLDRQEQIRQKVVQALIYPALLTFVSLTIVLFLLTYVTPQIINVFAESNKALPLSTTILLSVSLFIKDYGLLILGGIAAIVILFFRLLRIETFRKHVDTFLLRLPLIGKTIKLTETARFLRTLAILSHATVPILQAFGVASELVNSRPIRKEILIAKDRVKEGTSIYTALKQAKYFNASSLQFIASGESSGNLEGMLEQSANNQERHVQFTINAVLTTFEPLLIIFMGAIVLFIVLATLLPIFQLSSMVG